MAKYDEVLPTIPLQPNSGYARPPEPPLVIHLDDPALDIMINFEKTNANTTEAKTPIDEALKKMRASDVHVLLVIDNKEKIIGIISSEAILGQEPMRLMQTMAMPREKITVKMLMIPQGKITTFDAYELRHAKVGHIIYTLQELKQHYALIVNVAPKTKKHTICGLFSSHYMSNQLGQDVTKGASEAHSLAELRHKLNPEG